MIKEIKPPHKVDFEEFSKENVYTIFLAGSIIGTNEEWQTIFKEKLTKKLKSGDNVVLLNPRRDDWDDSWGEGNPELIKQINWELDGLSKVNLIAMYFDPITKAPITLLELGKFANSKRIVVSCPKGFYRKTNVDVVCERDNVPMVKDLDELVSGTILFYKYFKLSK